MVSVNGQQVALLHYEKGVDPVNASADSPLGADNLRTPIRSRSRPGSTGVGLVRRAGSRARTRT